MSNRETQIIIDWLKTNEVDEEFYSPADAKAFVARKLGVSLSKVYSEVKDSLLVTSLDKVNWDYIYYQSKKEKKVPLLSQEDHDHLGSIGQEINYLKKKRAEFLKSKGYKLKAGESGHYYWVHESIYLIWEETTLSPLYSVLQY